MCILLCYTYATCPHVAKSGIYTCYAAKTSGRGFDEMCTKFKVTSQKLRWKKEPKRCESCLEAFGEEVLVRRMRIGKVKKEVREMGEVESGGGDSGGRVKVREVVKDVGNGQEAPAGDEIMEGEKVAGEDSKVKNTG
ncbi:hypothetical protein ONS95_012309 [Cadophora gregata]|uniref:uncharacterized protein n=1 Tax=Cadophora gregata TaxID=51156 RepID=UPI0026DD75B9|nr:uncharacterized protein ONS95_012309 [Cadophora gregata]KAK0117998.1 hypothetical protein ONS95_012309 [Cadophora gregata]KAK0123065.1 hypothetical protein ONS96_010073 [Cadophora gregata f. sp. sojae]